MSWWHILKRNQLARWAGILLIVLYACSILGEFVAPYGPVSIQTNGSLLPPTQLHWRTPAGRWLGPHVYPTTQGPVELETGDRQLNVDFSHPYVLRLFVRGEPYRWLGLIEGDRRLFGVVRATVESPATTTDRSSDAAALQTEGTNAGVVTNSVPVAYVNVLGTDDQGRDYFSRLVYGSRVSLFVGIVGICISFPIGLFIGGLAGYFSGWIDTVLMRLVEVVLSIPGLYLLVSLAAVLQENPFTGVPLSNVERFFAIVAITSFVGWAGLARVIRGQVLSIRQREFIQASQAAGAGTLYLIWRHILPQTATYTIIAATLTVPSFIAAESVLSLIGLGIQQPDASWGNMLSLATNASVMVLQPWLIISPTVLVVITVLSFNVLGDGLRDALDPRDRR